MIDPNEWVESVQAQAGAEGREDARLFAVDRLTGFLTLQGLRFMETSLGDRRSKKRFERLVSSDDGTPQGLVDFLISWQPATESVMTEVLTSYRESVASEISRRIAAGEELAP